MINIATILRHNVIGKLLNHIIVFFINILIVQLLGAGGSGEYFNELYLLNFIVFIFSMGLDYMTIALLAQHKDYLRTIRQILFAVVLSFSALLFITVYFIRPDTAGWITQPASAVILFSIGNMLLIFYQGLLSALKKFNLQNIILIITNTAFLAWLFFLRPGIEPSVNIIATAYGILFFIQGLLMLAASGKHTTANKLPINRNSFFKKGLFIMASSLVYFAFLRIDNFFVEKYCDPVTLGNYVQCGKVGQYFIYFSTIISSTLLPFIAKETIGSSYSEWMRMMRPYLLLVSLAAIFIGATGKFFFPLLFGEEFSPMYSIMLILLPGFVCLGMLTLINSVYIGKGNIRTIFAGDLLGLVLVLFFDWLLIPAYGVYAAAIISSVSYMIVFLFLLRSFKKQFLRAAGTEAIVQL